MLLNLDDMHTNIYFAKITAAKNEVMLSYHRVQGLYSLAVIFAATIDLVHCMQYIHIIYIIYTIYILCILYKIYKYMHYNLK